MDEAQSAKLNAWMNSKCTQHNCPSCGRNQWGLGMVIAAPEATSEGLSIGGPSVPMVQVICNHCAYVKPYAAVPIGLAS